MDKTYRTCLYGRTSKDDDRRCSIENQQGSLRKWSLDDSWVDKSHVGEFWDADVSGKIPLAERPAGKRMLEAIERGEYDSVAVKYADRFGRTTLDGLQAAAELEKRGVKLVTTDEGWDARKNDDPMYFQMRLVIAEAEHRRILQRFHDGKERFMENRQAPPGGPLTFGYRHDEHNRFVVWPEQAAIVIEVFERFLRGDTQRDILRWMVEQGVQAGRRYQKLAADSKPMLASSHVDAKLWDTKVHDILTNKTYIGERKWGKRVFPCEAIISKDIFLQAQRRLESQSDGRTRLRGDPEHGLLSGLLRCGLCGKRVHVGNEKSNPRGKVYRYRSYRCDGLKDGSNCKCKKLDQKKLDAAVWDIVQGYLWNPGELLAQVAESDRTLHQSSAELLAAEEEHGRRMEEINQQVQEVWKGQAENQWPMEWVSPRLNALNAIRKQEQAKMEAARRSLADQSQEQDKLKELQASLVSIRLRLAEGLSAKEKRHILELLVSSAVVETEGTGQRKTGRLRLGLRWGECITPELVKDWAFTNSGVYTISLCIAM